VSALRFAELAYPDVAAVLDDRRRVVLLLPLGATEPHGPHAPLATDTLISVGVCERAAALLADDPDVRALVLPPLAYGVTRYACAFSGAVSVSEATLKALVMDVCSSLAAQGFSQVVLVNNHLEPEQVQTLREVAEELAPGVRLLDLTRRRNAERLTEEFRAGSCHAGRYETSLVLAAEPALVGRERMATLESRMIDMPAAIAAGRTDFTAMGMDQAYCGAPAEASAEEGERTFATLTEMLIEVVREVARGGDV
jgi:creatinine amidohydrolase